MTIYALIGASGTGKSHRASMVAVDKGLDTIVDDGLLIHGGRIIAGSSAKRENTRVAAVRRAILDDPSHAEGIRQALDAIHPEAFLILGTSKHMVGRILSALALEGVPVEWISIDSITTFEERQAARRIRLDEGKHVIPAPTMEVKKSFSGYVVDPMRFMFRGRGHQVEVEKSIVRPTYSSLGRFYIADTVVTAIVIHTARAVVGVARVSRVMVQSSTDGVVVQLDVVLDVRHLLFDCLSEVQREVSHRIETMTSLNVLGVRVEARHIT